MIGIKQSTGKNVVILVTKLGKCICFDEQEVRPMGRGAGGVRGINLEKDDEVVAMDLADPDAQLLVVSQNGFGKKTPISEYKTQRRGGMGVLTYNKAMFKKTGELVGAAIVSDEDDIMLINSDGILIRVDASEISKMGRATKGVKLMNVGEETKIIAMAKAAKEEDDDSAGDEGEPDPGPGPSQEPGPGPEEAEPETTEPEQIGIETEP